MADEIKNDHDLLIGVAKTIELEFKNIKAQIEDLKSGTTNKISDLYTKYEELEKWKTEHEQANKDSARNDKNYMKFIIALGMIIFALLIWHITGGVGGFHI